MINVSQQRALLHRIMDECTRLEQERTTSAEQVFGVGHANADPYTDGYLDAIRCRRSGPEIVYSVVRSASRMLIVLLASAAICRSMVVSSGVAVDAA